jgi:tRNASer (uridine44-2'-O)-methyltransferase
MPQGEFEQGLEQGESRYKAYLKWLGWTGLNCGWKWEIEPLRVPSTKSWAIVGMCCALKEPFNWLMSYRSCTARTRWATTQEQIDQCRGFALQQINKVRQDGFLVRQEGNLDNH